MSVSLPVPPVPPAPSALPLITAIPAVRRRMIVAWAVALALGTVCFWLADWSAKVLPQPSPLEELAYYPSGEHLERAAFGHRESAADMAWLRAVQYYGEHRHTDNRFEHLYHVFDILTSLAPEFESPYVFGAFSLAQEGFDFPRAEALMHKGIDRNPTSARLAFEMAFLYYVKPGGRDLEHAAEYFERSAKLSSEYSIGRRFAAYCRQHAGNLVLAHQLWAEVRRNSENDYMREIADKEMRRIERAMATGRKELAMQKLTTPIVLIKHVR